MLLPAATSDWDAMSREQKVLSWVEFWLQFWEQRGSYHVPADEPFVMSEGLVNLLEEIRASKEKRAPDPLSSRRRNPRLGEDIGQPIC